MSGQHTPGPWTWGYNPHCRTEMPILSSEAGEVCHFGDCERYYPTEGAPPNLADSRLIAAAPDLLAALKDALGFLEDWEDLSNNSVAHKIRAAIAKATGSAA